MFSIFWFLRVTARAGVRFFFFVVLGGRRLRGADVKSEQAIEETLLSSSALSSSLLSATFTLFKPRLTIWQNTHAEMGEEKKN